MADKIDKTLLLLRYALGFRDWVRAQKSEEIDLARGGFQTVFIDTGVKVWRKTPPLDDVYSASEVQQTPVEATMRRWFVGTKPSAKSIPGIIFTINKILERREKEGTQFVFPGADRVPHIPSNFRLDRFHLAMETRVLAKEIGVDIEEFDGWREKAESAASKGRSNERLSTVRGLSGFYFIYRINAFKPEVLHRTVMIVREEADRDHLALYMLGKSERMWRGDLVVGRSTLSSLIERSSEFHGRQINVLSLTYDHEDLNYETDIFAGFRTRVVSQSEAHMLSYRIIVAKQKQYADMVDEDMNDEMSAAHIGSLCKSEEPDNTDDLRWYQALQIKPSSSIRGRKFEANGAFNLFSLPDLSQFPKKKRTKKH